MAKNPISFTPYSDLKRKTGVKTIDNSEINGVYCESPILFNFEIIFIYNIKGYLSFKSISQLFIRIMESIKSNQN